MANASAARRPDTVPANDFPRTLDQIANAAGTPPALAEPPPVPGRVAAGSSGPTDTALHVLFGYIPTEILTLYVAVLAALRRESDVTRADWLSFWIFLAATPVVVWLVYGAKLKALQKSLPLRLGAWPVWEMFAATAAYSAWAFALPNSPFSTYPWYSSALSGLAVLIVSTLLGLIAPFLQRPLAP